MPAGLLSYNHLNGSLNRSPRRARIFPSPWRFEEFQDGYRILDANGCVLAYVVASEQSAPEKGLTADEAWRLARVIASLPELIKETSPDLEQRSWWKWLKPRSN